MYRKAYVEINVDNIVDNVNNIINKYNDYQYYIAVVKGNAYGHGAYLSKYLENTKINYLAVSSLDEAIEIRKYVNMPILCLEPINLEYIDIVAKNNIAITISSIDYYHELLKLNVNRLKAHLKLNTGMNRLGINDKNEVEEIYNNLINNKKIELEGIYTHLCTTGTQDTLYDTQINNFKELTSNIDLSLIKIVHLGRSTSIELHPKISFANGVRLGVIMYGIGQSFNRYLGFKGKLRQIKHALIVNKYKISKTYESSDLSLKTGFSLKSEIMEINKVKVGEKVGYGGTYTAKEDILVAVCPIGYADGLSSNYNKSEVLINNKKYKIIGVINMGMITIEVDNSVKLNDIVTILGDGIDIKRTSNILGVTPYMAMTQINKELPRKYIKDNKLDKEI